MATVPNNRTTNVNNNCRNSNGGVAVRNNAMGSQSNNKNNPITTVNNKQIDNGNRGVRVANNGIALGAMSSSSVCVNGNRRRTRVSPDGLLNAVAGLSGSNGRISRVMRSFGVGVGGAPIAEGGCASVFKSNVLCCSVRRGALGLGSKGSFRNTLAVATPRSISVSLRTGTHRIIGNGLAIGDTGSIGIAGLTSNNTTTTVRNGTRVDYSNSIVLGGLNNGARSNQGLADNNLAIRRTGAIAARNNVDIRAGVGYANSVRLNGG